MAATVPVMSRGQAGDFFDQLAAAGTVEIAVADSLAKVVVRVVHRVMISRVNMQIDSAFAAFVPRTM